jgi:cobalamin biosynthetic protein CobC
LQPDGLLIVGEAFADCAESNSSLQLDDHKGLIIWRSLGKYFGLEGLLVGFVLSKIRHRYCYGLVCPPPTVSGDTSDLLQL